MVELKDKITLAMQSRGMIPADLCKSAGMGSSKLSQILSGKVSDPRLSTVIKIAKALDVSLDWLAGLDERGQVQLSPPESELIANYRCSTAERRTRMIRDSRDYAAMSKEAAVVERDERRAASA